MPAADSEGGGRICRQSQSRRNLQVLLLFSSLKAKVIFDVKMQLYDRHRNMRLNTGDEFKIQIFT